MNYCAENNVVQSINIITNCVISKPTQMYFIFCDLLIYNYGLDCDCIPSTPLADSGSRACIAGVQRASTHAGGGKMVY